MYTLPGKYMLLIISAMFGILLSTSAYALAGIQDLRLLKAVHGEEVTSRYDIAPLVLFGYAYVAKAKGKVIGAITAWQTPQSEVNINDWVVHRDYRRQGVGEKLYLKLILETKGKIILSLVDIKNAASMKAHEKLGFKVVQKMQDAYQLGRGDEQALWKLENR